MATQLTIIGLGRIGLSIGLALSENDQGIVRVGNDIEQAAEQRANKLKAVDRCIHSLSEAVKEADIVFLCVEVDQVLSLLEVIKDDLKPGAIVIDTSPLVVPILDWAAQNLPAEHSLIKFVPSLSPDHIHIIGTDPNTASADLFQRATILISVSADTNPEAFRLAGELVSLLGANPLYTDPYESDGLIAMANLLPGLAALALMRTVTAQPGWRDSQKIASGEFHSATQALLPHLSRRQPGQAFIANGENAARLVGNLIEQLKSLQAMLANQNEEALSKAFQEAGEKRSQWVSDRQEAKWAKQEQIEVPTAKRGLLGMFSPIKRNKDTSNKN